LFRDSFSLIINLVVHTIIIFVNFFKLLFLLLLGWGWSTRLLVGNGECLTPWGEVFDGFGKGLFDCFVEVGFVFAEFAQFGFDDIKLVFDDFVAQKIE